jgi:hypothetical protein
MNYVILAVTGLAVIVGICHAKEAVLRPQLTYAAQRSADLHLAVAVVIMIVAGWGFASTLEKLLP